MASGSREKCARALSSVRPRALRPPRTSLALIALLLGACQTTFSDPPDRISGAGAAGGFGGAGGAPSGSAAGKASIAGGLGIGGEVVILGCNRPDTEPIFEAQQVYNGAPVQKVLYSWTTPEQVVELRRDRQLFVRSEQAGMGRGYAFTAIATLAKNSLDADSRQLAERLSTDLFPKIRYAWPNPWATRLGFPGEDYGNQLLRIVLKEEAWTALIKRGNIVVQDSTGQAVPLSSALATPERIGAIYFVKDEFSGGLGCSGTFQTNASGAVYREFILGNEAMIEEWSLATPEILQRMMDDIALLSTFHRALRDCAPAVDLSLFSACEWSGSRAVSDDDVASYLRALALASDNYLPASAQIAKIVDTLEGDLFEPDPLLVTPGQ